ncbi:c-type cytochrome [Azospirillum argentinense]|uniref:Cytochrome c domain-containing protein n=1 Tax=Azospirillum argentinense TaxID=2970906 RepID=A0A5B0KU95_9PROT|nr:c-type cytochrome [Azospirillum argentinense]KAA1056132.1 Cytochrome c oxidase polypeptide III [Azospirillum argentinense]
MSSLSRNTVSLALLGVLLLAACEREERSYRGEPVGEIKPGAIVQGTLYAGAPSPPPAQRREYEGNAYHVSEGKRLFEWFNCSGCHAHGGGDIGPPLMDAVWIYGGELENIAATIVEGRPNGMPSFRNKIPDQQLWQIAAYVRSMQREVRKDVAPGRDDHMAVTPGEQNQPVTPPKPGGVASPSSEGRGP